MKRPPKAEFEKATSYLENMLGDKLLVHIGMRNLWKGMDLNDTYFNILKTALGADSNIVKYADYCRRAV